MEIIYVEVFKDNIIAYVSNGPFYIRNLKALEQTYSLDDLN